MTVHSLPAPQRFFHMPLQKRAHLHRTMKQLTSHREYRRSTKHPRLCISHSLARDSKLDHPKIGVSQKLLISPQRLLLSSQFLISTPSRCSMLQEIIARDSIPKSCLRSASPRSWRPSTRAHSSPSSRYVPLWLASWKRSCSSIQMSMSTDSL